MTTRLTAPTGAPCWIDLWTSDVEGSRKFYTELFGWEALEPNPDFGGYFMFARNGVPLAGGMGDMGDMKADNTWKIYFNTDDITRTLTAAEVAGAAIGSPAVPVADLGIQAVLDDPTGARLGAWQPGTFPGFTVWREHGTPSWFELHTSDHAAALDFYRDVFLWETDMVSDSDEFRYATMRDPDGESELAGVMDARAFVRPGQSYWSVYWQVDDIDESVAKAVSLGATVEDGATDTPHGRLAVLHDISGTRFKLRTPPAG